MNAQAHFKAEPFAPEAPQPLLRDIPPGAPFPADALGPLRPAVDAVKGVTQAPLAIPAASGERKSSCDAPLMAALHDFEKEQARARRDAFGGWQNALALWKATRDRILSEAKSAKGEKRTAAQADLGALGPEPAAPPSADRTVTEPTFEGLTRLFAEGQPSLGIFSDEGGQFLGGHGMNSDNRQKTLAALNDLWQGNPIRRTRAGEGHATLYGRRLAVHLMVQPTVARGFMADPLAAGTGFLARFLICEPPSTIGTRFHGRALLVRFADTIEAEQAPGRSLAHVTAAASKAAEQAARIAGVLTLWRDLHAPEVTAAGMADGIALAQFYLAEAARLADAAAYLAFLRRNVPYTSGAAAWRLGWGAGRAWQAEARLSAAGLVRILPPLGKAHPVGDADAGETDP